MIVKAYSMHYLLHAADLLEDRLRRRLAEADIQPRQARVLDALDRMEPASQIALARAFDVTPASMSTMTARLLDRKLITRETHPEAARSNLLRLTPRGRDLLAEIHAAWTDMDRLMETELGADKAASLAELTRQLRDSLGGRVPGADEERPLPNGAPR
ncbi:DNA-binding MarR family transcriptional regulator [Limimaricola soesokkakensis]|uniref:DNA-binding MarR family transcriptional regulator n=1 Tax=Limimaricola soesokkakensis TaxID=1343159 RepID=A0A1X6ZD54_9RHOB|nr:MarR family transcriptional regulator [Limimaricola soesokkakensis]PSK86344.1 DNA-binding MarR family transcriptional regulator [Limimaricola soesokkakensis]SLN47425.1 MarR family protein [Limimaricola soesokkakensis]